MQAKTLSAKTLSALLQISENVTIVEVIKFYFF